MSTSLLLALLETIDPNEPNRSQDYYRWIKAHWDGTKYSNGIRERRELMLRELYDVLQSTINVRMPASVSLGTVLARTLTDDPSAGLQEAARRLRATLRAELLSRLDALIAGDSGTSGAIYGQGCGMLPEQQDRRQLWEENQRLRRERDHLRETLRILARESK